MSELTAARWKRGDGRPSSHPVREVLERALFALDSGEQTADHIMVILGKDGDGKTTSDDWAFYQAGSFSYFGQLGLLNEATSTLREASSI